MCLKNYDFVILDNAFVVHGPHIKDKTDFDGQIWSHHKQINRIVEFMRSDFSYQVHSIYGRRRECQFYVHNLTKEGWRNRTLINKK